MKNYLKTIPVFICSIFIFIPINAQLPDYLNPTKDKQTNMFIFGDSVTTPEKNFENMFKNFSHFVRNADDFDLFSYEHVCTLKSTKQAKKYLRKNDKTFDGWMIFSAISSCVTHITDTIIREYDGRSSIEIFKSTPRPESKADRKNSIDTFSKYYLSVGDRVYKIKFIYRLQEYDYYMFVDSKTNKVITKYNLFASELPLDSMLK